MKILALIPARKNSKSIPNKNIFKFHGIPLIGHAINCALQVEEIDKVIFSSDSDEYISIAQSYGAHSFGIRPPELALDETPMKDVVSFELNRFIKHFGYTPDLIFIIQPTQPLRQPHHLRRALNIIIQKGSDSVVSVVKIPQHFNPQYAMKIVNESLVPFLDKGPKTATRRQDCEAAYSRDGTLYLFKTEVFVKLGNIYGNCSIPLILETNETINIDEQEDLEILKKLEHPVAKGRLERVKMIGYDYSNEPKKTLGTSNLSGARSLFRFCQKDRYGFDVDVMLCPESGHVFLDPVLTDEAYGRFYNRYYRPLVSAFHNREINSNTIQSEQISYAHECHKVLKGYYPIVKGDLKIIDIGGSTGVVSREISSLLSSELTITSKITLLDPSMDELANAKKFENFEIHNLTGEKIHTLKKKWDLALICQTVDHLIDITGVLTSVHKSLTDNGVVFVDIVDWEYLLHRTQQISETIKIDHPNYLTMKTMEAFLIKCNFEVLHKNLSKDNLHVAFICKKAASPRSIVVSDLKCHADYLISLIRKYQAFEKS